MTFQRQTAKVDPANINVAKYHLGKVKLQRAG